MHDPTITTTEETHSELLAPDQEIYMNDITASPVLLSTSYAATSVTEKYDPYGANTETNVSGGSGAAQNPFLFHYGIQDRVTDTVKYGARWYDPTTGTFTQQDTLDAPLDPGNANRYLYAGADPINHMDPTGQFCWPWDDDCIYSPIADVDTSEDELQECAIWGIPAGIVAGPEAAFAGCVSGAIDAAVG